MHTHMQPTSYQFKPPQNGDLIPLGAFVSAFGLDLDGKADTLNYNQVVSNRYQGLTFFLEIYYTNIGTPNGMIHYQYRPIYAGSNFKVVENIFAQYPSMRYQRDRHAISVITLQTGQIGSFSITTLLIQLTASMALIAVSTIIVDSLALYVMPQRKLYRLVYCLCVVSIL